MGIAHELITRGWHQGDYVGPDGSVCLMGAAECMMLGTPYGKADRLVPGTWSTRCRVLEALQQAVGNGENIAQFNDTPGRTFDEVLRVAKHADEILGAAA